MKGVKGRLLRKLKSIPQVTAGSFHVNLPPDAARVFRDLSNGAFSGGFKAAAAQCQQIPAALEISRDFEGHFELLRPPDPSHPFSNGGAKADLLCDPVPADPVLLSEKEDEDLVDDDEERWFSDDCSATENENPTEAPPPSKDPSEWEKKKAHGSPRNSPLFRRPRLNSPTLFDPDLLAAFEKAVEDYKRAYEEVRDNARPVAAARNPQDPDYQQPLSSDPACISHPLDCFELRCPPGGSDAVVLYTTSLRGIRKTFEDCSRVRHLLRSLRVAFYERDVSMHSGFRDELWAALGGGRVIPPRLFVKGRYLGGADNVVGLHERGELIPLLDGLVLPAGAGGGECEECGGFMFLLCSECRGGRKVYSREGSGATPEQCRHCNENGLVVCTQCSTVVDGG